MKLWKNAVRFYIGGSAYMFLEFAWRGRSHGSMFLLGGGCFLLLGKLLRLRLPLWCKPVLGAAMVTVLELLTGLVVNRDYGVWDYRSQMFHFKGQICPAFSLLWMPVTLLGMWLYEKTDKILFDRRGDS